MAATGKVLGTVTSVVGEVKATAADGTVRILQIGDQIHADETLNTGTLGSINIVMENGATLDCGANTDLAMHEGMLGIATAVTAPSTAAPAADVAALQAAIAAGQDPSQVAQATAAGGAPAAGGADGGGGTPVILEQTNSADVVAAGFTTEGAGIGFPAPEFQLENPIIPQPTVSVAVDVSVSPDTGEGGGGTDPGIVVSGNTASLIEGTNGADGKLVTFVVSLTEAFDQPVTVTYDVLPGTAETPSDYGDHGTLSGTVTIPAGETEFFVTVVITQDHLVEGNESFRIVLNDAINATIDPNADEVVVTIVDDDLQPIARDDAFSVNEGETLTGNVLSQVDEGESADDTAQGPETLQVITGGTFATEMGGSVVLASDGSFTYTPPSENYNGPDSFQYTIREMADGEFVNDPDTATVSINVVAVNDPPVAVGEAFETQEDTALAGVVTGNDTDIEDGTNLTYVLVDGPSNAASFALNADGSFDYQPALDFHGPDSFTYKVVDTDGLESNVVIDNSGSFEDAWRQVQAAWGRHVPAGLIEAERVAAAPKGAPFVERAGPRQADEIASFITEMSKGRRKLARSDIMSAFGEKAFLLLKVDGHLVGLAGWQVENLVARASDVYLESGLVLGEAVRVLLDEIERASFDLQCEALLLFLPPHLARHNSVWGVLGYEMRAPQDLEVSAWKEAALESMPVGMVMLFKQLRKDRVMRPV